MFRVEVKIKGSDGWQRWAESPDETEMIILRDTIIANINKTRNRLAMVNKRTRGDRATLPKRYPIAARVTLS